MNSKFLTAANHDICFNSWLWLCSIILASLKLSLSKIVIDQKLAPNKFWFVGRIFMMRRKSANCWVEYTCPIGLMYHTSNMEIGLCWYNKGTNKKWTPYLTNYFVGYENYDCNSFNDICCRPICLWLTSRVWKVFDDVVNKY